ncbi:uncharacterized protein LACBIDRAFT_325634 [Laccaria bicolor S238N-H82]|uniref:Predicted protein n=1 Tax=Laccaria bicolor (strain S238N-H82 / ATCC MYA-4686) TaxID=486041 RepID=B0D5Q3_LACBS|nr:uncharacterized protein LACBIDRAFT_325634 [Laccaria bicolor S238N-H82]EDR09811.1 predicted protein [Laccaria bicolor S238N-H82]|eukprot:XP_001879196.1 predicted protein [Laccaria bicolor S238N-H82]
MVSSVVEATQDVDHEGITYRPQTGETRAVYEIILSSGFENSMLYIIFVASHRLGVLDQVKSVHSQLPDLPCSTTTQHMQHDVPKTLLKESISQHPVSRFHSLYQKIDDRNVLKGQAHQEDSYLLRHNCVHLSWQKVGNKASTGNPTFQVDEYDPSQSGETYAGEVAFKRKEADAEGRSEPHSRNRKSGATDLADLIFKAFTLTCFLCSDLWGALVASLRSGDEKIHATTDSRPSLPWWKMRNKSSFITHNNPTNNLLESNGTQGRTIYLDFHNPAGLFILIACETLYDPL